jgi:decaprenylphospho-beta-D-erythro-pentofuranosid-2-ulose 2-reductase
MRKVLIVGATSMIAYEVSKCFAAQGDHLLLIGRNEEKLATLAADLTVRGAGEVDRRAVDLNQLASHAEWVQEWIEILGGIDVALIAHGTLPDQPHCERHVGAMLTEFMTNCVSTISLLTVLANYFESRCQGCLAVISSVAGDRGRQSNYVYGAAKGAVSLFSQGLRSRLSRSGVGLVTIKPGFVDTPMTAHLPKNLLYASAATVGKRIYQAIEKRENIVYVPWFWRWILFVVKSIPERVYKRVRL